MTNFFYILKALGVKCSYSYAKDRFLAQERNHTLWGIKKLLEHYGVQVTAVKSEAKSLPMLLIRLYANCQRKGR